MKVCLPFTAPHTQNRKDVNRISFLSRGYAFNCLVAVIHGYRNVWEAQYVENSKSVLEIFKQKVKDCFNQEWHSRLENSSKDSNRARTFIHLSNFKAQPYLDIITVKKFQTSLS